MHHYSNLLPRVMRGKSPPGPAVGSDKWLGRVGLTSIVLAIVLILTAATFVGASAQDGPTVQILSPRDGDVLQGESRIVGTVQTQAFLSAQLEFAYASDGKDAWFTIAEIAAPVENDELAVWDTTQVTDGEYQLRLQLAMLDGTNLDVTTNVEIRNYSMPLPRTPIASPTSPPPLQVETPLVVSNTAVGNAPAIPSPTSLPPNPAALTPGAILGGGARGALAVLAAGLLILIVLFRRRS